MKMPWRFEAPPLPTTSEFELVSVCIMLFEIVWLPDAVTEIPVNGFCGVP